MTATRPAFLRAEERPRPQARSLQRDRGAAPDRLDLLARRGRQRQPRALQLLQRVLLRAADHRLLLHQLEGQRRQHPGHWRVCLEPGDDGSRQAHECDRGAVARDVDEFKLAGLTQIAGKLVNVPRVAESPVSFECKVSQIIQLQGADGKRDEAWLTLDEVVAVHIDKAFIKDGVYQTGLAHPIVRAGRRGDYFEIKPENMFEMIRPD